MSRRTVILTVNGHLESFGVETGRLMQLFLFAVMTPKLDADALARLGGRPRWGITPSDPMGTTMRRIDGGAGRRPDRDAHLRGAAPRDAGRRRGHGARGEGDAAQVRRALPAAGRDAMEYAWAGHLCLTLNGVSVMREIDDGLSPGCVQNGLGTARGTLTGIGAAELACGATSDVTAHFTAADRPETPAAAPAERYRSERPALEGMARPARVRPRALPFSTPG
jgi:hypothetical protein